MRHEADLLTPPDLVTPPAPVLDELLELPESLPGRPVSSFTTFCFSPRRSAAMLSSTEQRYDF